MSDNPMITAANGELISFRDYVDQASIVFQCTPKEAVEKLIETAGMDEETANQLREMCDRLYGAE